MVDYDYDPKSPESILSAAKKLTGKTLRYFMPSDITNEANKGDLGTLVENYFFFIQPGNSPEPDFKEANLELKTTGLVKRPDGSYRAKERLVLTMINYETLAEESWATSSFVKKCSSMLLLFYEYVKELSVIDRKFVIDPLLYNLPEEDKVQIRRDWEAIQAKIRAGKAHELSEGDTFYLGACRKGSGGPNEKLRKQPFSEIPAKARAFSFKQGYVDFILAGHISKLGSLGVAETVTIEDATQVKFAPFIGKTIEELSSSLASHKTSAMQKGFHRGLAERILSDSGSSVKELVKAGIELKTIRVNAKGRPNEAMSFPGFKFLEIVDEVWEESGFANKIEQKFLFVIYQEDIFGVERLWKVAYWNMPYPDREEAHRVWQETKSRVQVDAKNLPKATESPVAHVRPKARNAADVLPTPQGDFHTKQCFWLNQSYIQQVIESL
jgi:DNA mismatch repair protein MutH